MSGWSVAVVIPAHNEGSRIAACLQSILRAAARTPGIDGLWLVVAADACTDETVRAASRAMGASGEVVAVSVRSAGEARRLGTQAALAHFWKVPRQRLWVACTDGDTCVRSDWLRAQLAAANQGVQGLAGIVELLDGSAWVREVHAAHYPINADGSHSHVHGANLAFRADAYLDAGGWRNLALAEDHCLWQRLKAGGWRLRASAASVVLTSARERGRAEGGFATTLKSRLEWARARARPASTMPLPAAEVTGIWL